MWKKSEFNSIKAYVEHNTGMSEAELLNDTKNYRIQGLEKIRKRLLEAVKNHTHITCVGDYDVDGVSSMAILSLLLKYLGADYNIRIPKRFTEGYGLNMKIIDEITDGLMLTADNGIAAVDQIKAAKAKGLEVIVTDHHLARADGIIPEADIIVAPEAFPETSDFDGYCGAAICYKLAEPLVKDEKLLQHMKVLAGIATVADVMPLIWDNRNIVKEMLSIITNKSENLRSGLKALLLKGKIENPVTTDISFKIAPMLNACSRMFDEGAVLAYNALILDETEGIAFQSAKMAVDIDGINEMRKQKTLNCLAYVERQIVEENLTEHNPMVVYGPEIPPGIIGLVAGKLAEKYKRPAICFADGPNNLIKGSARNYVDYDIKALLDLIANKLVGYGGHKAAAGITGERSRYQEIRQALWDKCDYEAPENDDEYLLEIKSYEVAHIYQELVKYAPYGEHNPMPVFKIRDIHLLPDNSGQPFRIMAVRHIKFHSEFFNIVAFDFAEKYMAIKENPKMDENHIDTLYGTIGLNWYKGFATLQIETTGIEFRKRCNEPTAFAKILRGACNG